MRIVQYNYRGGEEELADINTPRFNRTISESKWHYTRFNIWHNYSNFQGLHGVRGLVFRRFGLHYDDNKWTLTDLLNGFALRPNSIYKIQHSLGDMKELAEKIYMVFRKDEFTCFNSYDEQMAKAKDLLDFIDRCLESY